MPPWAIAVLEGSTAVTIDNIRRVVILCLRHRLQKDPLTSIDSSYKVEKVFNQLFGGAIA
jgi:magnesium chelatase subunit I